MQSSVRAVEAYRRSRLIDNITTDEDKVSPVYLLEEICTLLRNSPLDIVREMLEYTLKRLESKSPIVKFKTLRFMKYAASKGGAEFKREMQRQAGVIRQLFHYKGQPDPLKGDALNRAVRDTAHEAVSAIFGSEERVTTLEDVGKRIQGFGSTNFDAPREEEKKSVLSGLVGFGSQSIRQSIDMISNYNHYSGSGSAGNKNAGSYRAQGLRRSLTTERERPFDRGEIEHWNGRDADESRQSSSPSEDSYSKSGNGNGRGSRNEGRGHTSEDRLLDSLTAPGGVRLQPTRETLHTFTVSTQKLDAGNLVLSLESKLKAHSWQVRFKALCLLEASIKNREENKVLDAVVAMFEEDASAIVDSLQSPQTSLREKAKKVMEMIGAGMKDSKSEESAESHKVIVVPKLPPPVAYPDLMDTKDFDLLSDTENLQGTPSGSKVEKPAHHDLIDENHWVNETSASASANDPEADPFAGMSFHGAENVPGNGTESDLFTGLDVDSGRRVGNGAVEGMRQDEGDNLFGDLSVTKPNDDAASEDNLVNLLGNLSTGSSGSDNILEQLHTLMPNKNSTQQTTPVSVGNISNAYNTQLPGLVGAGQVLSGTGMPPQMMYLHPSGLMPVPMPMNMPGLFPTNMIMAQALANGNINFNLPGQLGQQQFGAALPTMPMFGGVMPGHNINGAVLNQNFRDGFDFSSDATPRYATVEIPKEDTKAFDFITDHMSSVYGPKKSK